MEFDSTYRHKPQKCLSCGTVNDAETGDSERPPQAGDIAICAYCGKIMKFDEEMSFAELTAQDIAQLNEDGTLARLYFISEQIRGLKQTRNSKLN